MATRRAASTPSLKLPWGATDWSHAPAARTGRMGPCTHCGQPAMLRHPITGVPCHKVCDEKAT